MIQKFLIDNQHSKQCGLNQTTTISLTESNTEMWIKGIQMIMLIQGPFYFNMKLFACNNALPTLNMHVYDMIWMHQSSCKKTGRRKTFKILLNILKIQTPYRNHVWIAEIHFYVTDKSAENQKRKELKKTNLESNFLHKNFSLFNYMIKAFF